MERIKSIKKVLENKRFFLLFVFSGLLYGGIFAILTNVIDLRFGISNIRFVFTWINVVFFVIFSILGGVAVSVGIFAFRQKQRMSKGLPTGASGMLLSFVTSTCPVCKPLLLSFFGLSGSVFIFQYGIILAVASIFLLLLSIYLMTSNLVKKDCCPNKKN